MKFIAHRGNVHHREPKFENDPSYIQEALDKNFDAEVDLWYKEGWWLGHDEPQYKINESWLYQKSRWLWIHCKNTDALKYISEQKTDSSFLPHINYLNYFWHDKDEYTITSKKFIWCNIGIKLIPNSICVLPEIGGVVGDIKQCHGVCSDIINYWRMVW